MGSPACAKNSSREASSQDDPTRKSTSQSDHLPLTTPSLRLRRVPSWLLSILATLSKKVAMRFSPTYFHGKRTYGHSKPQAAYDSCNLVEHEVSLGPSHGPTRSDLIPKHQSMSPNKTTRSSRGSCGTRQSGYLQQRSMEPTSQPKGSVLVVQIDQVDTCNIGTQFAIFSPFSSRNPSTGNSWYSFPRFFSLFPTNQSRRQLNHCPGYH